MVEQAAMLKTRTERADNGMLLLIMDNFPFKVV
jgi:hypothetical protein